MNIIFPKYFRTSLKNRIRKAATPERLPSLLKIIFIRKKETKKGDRKVKGFDDQEMNFGNSQNLRSLDSIENLQWQWWNKNKILSKFSAIVFIMSIILPFECQRCVYMSKNHNSNNLRVNINLKAFFYVKNNKKKLALALALNSYKIRAKLSHRIIFRPQSTNPQTKITVFISK